jgi:hypothetical protein
MDAGPGSPMAFLGAQLELIRPKLIEPLSSMTYDRDINVTFGGGFVEYLSAWAADYGSTGENQYGLQGTNNTNIPLVQVNVDKGTWKAFIWQVSSFVADLDLKKLAAATANGQPAPFSLEKMNRTGVQLMWNKACELVTYRGFLGLPGLLNNSDVTSALAPAVGALNGVTPGTTASRLWINKTPQQQQADFNALILNGVKASNYSLEGIPNSVLMDWDLYNDLTQPYVLGGIGGYASILEYLLHNNIARRNGVDLKVMPIANPWTTGIGIGGANRMFAYRNEEDHVKLHVPAPLAPAMTVPTIDNGGGYQTLWNGSINTA